MNIFVHIGTILALLECAGREAGALLLLQANTDNTILLVFQTFLLTHISEM